MKRIQKKPVSDSKKGSLRNGAKERMRVVIRGAVQGVGFRPFVNRLANSQCLSGWIQNTVQGVIVEVEGSHDELEKFLLRIEKEKPRHAFIQSLESSFLDPQNYQGFEIRESEEKGEKTTLVLPDIATCPDCLLEIFNPNDRRYLYPFTNCTNCGPRYSIMETLPYDRSRTTMSAFRMCRTCQDEYQDPKNRRFHAQPNACPACGPQLELWDSQGNVLATHGEALRAAVKAVQEGRIVAVKGLGGFHLMVDARNHEAVERLREKKGREAKPFAVMFPSLERIKRDCEVSTAEERILLSPEAPIVLLSRKQPSDEAQVASSVAPRNPYLGVLLPYTPLHHVLMRELDFPVIATSGNLSDETICIDERDALDRLAGIAEMFLVHNRTIARHVDDSIVRIMKDRELVLRRARGFAPLPVFLKKEGIPLLAVGAQIKNTVTVLRSNQAIMSQHIGDLSSPQTYDAFLDVISSYKWFYGFMPEKVVCDLHPDYMSSRFARLSGFPVVQVQHHYAHILSCMAENEIEGPVLGVSWDGTGYGPDQTVWGGEFFIATVHSFERVGHLRMFTLPGSEKSIKEPRRTAIGLLYQIFGDRLFDQTDLAPIRTFSKDDLRIIRNMLKKDVQNPMTSSAGRLFDAVSSLIGIRQRNQYEGQAASELEYALSENGSDEAYPIDIQEVPIRRKQGGRSKAEFIQPRVKYILNWEPMIHGIIEDVRLGQKRGIISAKFHNALAWAIATVAERVAREKVVLSGGCFQNRYLTERVIDCLRDRGYRPYWHQRIPPNDGGISLGQLVAVSSMDN